jgi:hypothetical protein
MIEFVCQFDSAGMLCHLTQKIGGKYSIKALQALWERFTLGAPPAAD